MTLYSPPLQPQAQLGHSPPRYLRSQKLRRAYSCVVHTHDQHACANDVHSARALSSSQVKKRKKKKTIPAKYKEGEEQQTAAAEYDLYTET